MPKDGRHYYYVMPRGFANEATLYAVPRALEDDFAAWLRAPWWRSADYTVEVAA